MVPSLRVCFSGISTMSRSKSTALLATRRVAPSTQGAAVLSTSEASRKRRASTRTDKSVERASGAAASAACTIVECARRAGIAVGRPSEYESVMCDAVVAHARLTGLSLSAFADEIGVDRATLTRWAQQHPEFRTAIGRAKAARAKRLEVEVMASSNGPAISARILALKNCAEEDWRERQDQRVGGLPGAPPVQYATLDVSRVSAEQAYNYVINGAPLPPKVVPLSIEDDSRG